MENLIYINYTTYEIAPTPEQLTSTEGDEIGLIDINQPETPIYTFIKEC